MVAIGIDLGTSNSCVGVWLNNAVQIIPNDQGDRTTPTCVAFTDHERLIGDSAKNQTTINPSNTVFDTKRLLGRRFTDCKIQDEIRRWPFAVFNERDEPKINILFKGDWKTFAPEEISAMTLSKMKENAENFLGTIVQDAVISVPASFNDSQRQATIDAAKIAGLNVLKLINEPTAAALSYGLDKNLKRERQVIIFDLGGGTLDVSVLSIDDGSIYEVLATSGDTHFGGVDFDNKLVNHFVEVFERNYKKDLRTNPRAIMRLKSAAEKAKISLSYSTEVAIEIEALHEGIDFYTVITRAKFEELCSDLFQSVVKHLDKALKEANINTCAIDDIILVGGSSRIPKIKHILKKYFFGKQLNFYVNPNEAVAAGAAIQAAILTEAKFQNLLVVDVAPLSLGAEIVGQAFTAIAMKNTRIPCKKTITFSTFVDNQAVVSIKVFEESNHSLLGTFDLCGIPAAPMGVPKIKVVFDIDSNGILSVSATVDSKPIVVKKDKGRLSDEDIKRMKNDAEEYQQEDRICRKKIEARNNFEGHVLSLRHYSKDIFVPDYHKTQLRMLCDEALVWLESNIQASVEDYEEKLKDLIALCKPIVENILKPRCSQQNNLFTDIPMLVEEI